MAEACQRVHGRKEMGLTGLLALMRREAGKREKYRDIERERERREREK